MIQTLHSYIDHTLLRPDATQNQIKLLCEEAIHYQFASVCVNPTWVSFVASLLNGKGIGICSVVGFPLGANTIQVNSLETIQLIELGATEIDMVMNIGALKSQQYEHVLEDIQAVVMSSNGKLVKVIIECCLLTDLEKQKAAMLVKEAGAHFVKTSTGFSKGGATLEDIRLLKEVVGDQLGIKASGGISDASLAMELIAAGATRIGTSQGVKMMQ